MLIRVVPTSNPSSMSGRLFEKVLKLKPALGARTSSRISYYSLTPKTLLKPGRSGEATPTPHALFARLTCSSRIVPSRREAVDAARSSHPRHEFCITGPRAPKISQESYKDVTPPESARYASVLARLGGRAERPTHRGVLISSASYPEHAGHPRSTRHLYGKPPTGQGRSLFIGNWILTEQSPRHVSGHYASSEASLIGAVCLQHKQKPRG